MILWPCSGTDSVQLQRNLISFHLLLKCWWLIKNALDIPHLGHPEFFRAHFLMMLIWWCHPAISSSVVPFSFCPPVPPSIRVFSNESTLRMRWPKYWSFSCSISPSNDYPELISFRIDWFDLLTVQGTLKSLLQHHSLKAQLFNTQLTSQSNSHIHTWPLEKS